MPTLPARLAGTAERWFGRPATVTAVDDLSPGLRCVTLTGAELRGRRWSPGQEVEFRVAEREFRHYTPVSFDPNAGRFDVVFCDHSGGPGAAWARALAVGDEVGVLGPGGGLRIRPAAGPLLLLGDATALGLFGCLVAAGPGMEGWTGCGAPSRCRARTSERRRRWSRRCRCCRPPGRPAPRCRAGWPPAAGSAAAAPGAGPACLAGHAQTVQALRSRLRTSGLPRAAITTKAYWATGKRGL